MTRPSRQCPSQAEPARTALRRSLRELWHAFAGLLEVRIVHLHADVLTASQQRCRAGAAASSKWIENGLALEREVADPCRIRAERMDVITRIGRLAQEQHACAVLVAGDILMWDMSVWRLCKPVERMRQFTNVQWHLIVAFNCISKTAAGCNLIRKISGIEPLTACTLCLCDGLRLDNARAPDKQMTKRLQLCEVCGHSLE